jgi:hypothetical protein
MFSQSRSWFLTARLLLLALFATTMAGSVSFAQPTVARWTVSVEPSLRIGIVDGDDAYQWQYILAATKLADGSIVAADRRAGEIRFFSAAGKHNYTIGRRGEGPGEFRNPSQLLQRSRDTLVVFDDRNQAISTINLKTREVQTRKSACVRDDSSAKIKMRYSNAILIRNDACIVVFANSPATIAGAVRGQIRVRLTPADNGRTVTLGEFQGIENGRPNSNPGNAFVLPIYLNTAVTASSARIFIGDNAGSVVRTFDHSGGAHEPITLPLKPIPFSAVERADFRKRFLAKIAPISRQQAEELEMPTSTAAFLDLHADLLGHLWAQRPTIRQDAENAWVIVDVNGTTIGQATLPARFRPLEIGADYVLGVARDEDDVQFLQVHALTRR